ncbi:hypothetical protein MASR1M46_01210 [Bacteroidales bacterium]
MVTGATSGIGEAVAISLARAGYDLIITGRRVAQLTRVAKSIENDFKIKVLPLSFDVRELTRLNTIWEPFRQDGRKLIFWLIMQVLL